jgi:hypothetical protein
LGRRRSVEWTTERRCPSERGRKPGPISPSRLPAACSRSPIAVEAGVADGLGIVVCEAGRRGTMTLLARRSRPVYRIYTEADYLQAGADPFEDWQAAGDEPAAESAELATSAGEPVSCPARLSTPRRWAGCERAARERRLRRLAGAAALTGAVSTVGGLVGSTFVGGRSTARLVAGGTDRLQAPTGVAGTATTRSPARRGRGAAVSAARSEARGRVAASQARVRARRTSITDSPVRGRPIRRSLVRPGMAPAPSGVSGASAASSRPVSVSNAAQSASAQPAGGVGARAEFGFERR